MRRRLKIEQLELRRLLTAVSFGSPQLISDTSPRAIVTGDINSDGRVDLLSVNRGSVAWHSNEVNGDGSVTFVSVPILENLEAHSANLADLDGDSDLDLLVAGGRFAELPPHDWEIVWYENLDGKGTFAEAPLLIGQSSGFWLGVMETADIDGDDDLDVFVGTGGGLGDGALRIFENDGHGNFLFGQNPIASGAAISHLEVHDMDEDGDQDLAILFGSDFNWTLFAWYENAGDNETFDHRHIQQEEAFPLGGLLTDVDSDGDLDPVFGVGVLDLTITGISIGWNENLNGTASFEDRRVLWNAADEEGFDSLSVLSVLNDGDLNRDGHVDLLFRLQNDLRLLQNDGDGTFTEATIGEATGEIGQVVDINNDSRPDIVTSTEEGLVWLENAGEDPIAIPGDLDGDGQVNFPDFLILAANFGREDASPEDGDLTGDSHVDFADFLLFSKNFEGPTRTADATQPSSHSQT